MLTGTCSMFFASFAMRLMWGSAAMPKLTVAFSAACRHHVRGILLDSESYTRESSEKEEEK